MFAIYCPDLKGRFRPLDLVNGTTTTRKVYASVFNTKEEAIKAADCLKRVNKNIAFTVRKFK